MNLPLTYWNKTLKKLGFKRNRVNRALAPEAIRSRKQKRSRFGHQYEVLESRQLLAADGFFSVVDPWLDKSVQYTFDGEPVNRFSLDHSRAARGTAFSEDGELQFVVDASRRVHVFDVDQQEHVGSWRTTGLISPQGIAVDGNDLLIVDQFRDRVFRYVDATQHRSGRKRFDSSFRLRHGNRWPSGLTTDGQRIWVTDRWTDRVYVYGMEGEKLGNWRLDPVNRRPTGISVNPDNSNYIWIVDELRDEVFVYENGKNLRAGRHFADQRLPLQNKNWFAQGIAVSPVNENQVPGIPTITSIDQDSGANQSDGVTNDNRFAIEGAADAGTNVTIQMADQTTLGSGVADSNGRYRIDLTATLRDGEYSLTAVASNSNGSSDPSSPFRVVVDTAAPSAPLILNVDEDRGASPSDGITSDNSLFVSGQAEAGSLLTLAEASLGELQTVQVDANGNWSVDLASDVLPDGTYLFSAIATDLAGNFSNESDVFTLVVDTGAPVAPAIVSISDDRGFSQSDGITNIPIQQVSGTAEPGTTLRLSDDGVELGLTQVNNDGRWSVEVDLGEGEHRLVAMSLDVAGNESLESQPFRVVVDTLHPLAPTLQTITEDSELQDGVTSDNQISIAGVAQPFSIVQLSELALGELGTALANEDGNWELAVDRVLADGNYRFQASAEDIAGNVSDLSIPFEVVIDTLAPSVPSVVLVDRDTGEVDNDGVTSDTTLLFRGFAQPSTRVVLVDSTDESLGSTTADADGRWLLDLTGIPFAEGEYRLSAFAVDLAGNQSELSSEFRLTVDATAPVQPSIDLISDDTGDAQDGVTSDDTLIFSGSAESNSRVVLKELTLGELSTVRTDSAGFWTVDLTDTPLVDGSYQFSIVSFDLAGNESPASIPFDVVVDTNQPETPSITLFEEDTGRSFADGVTSDTTLVFRGLGPAGSRILVFESTLGQIGSTQASESGTWEFDATNQPFEQGTYQFQVQAENLAGNRSPFSASLDVVIDTTAPGKAVINSFENDTGGSDVDGITSDNSLVVFGNAEAFTQVTIQDAFLGALGTTFANENGDWQFELNDLVDGSYRVSANSVDAAGNQGEFSDPVEIVVDTIAPSVPSIIKITNDSGQSGNDGLTNDSSLLFRGIGEAGQAISLTEQSIGFELETVIGADGSWVIDATSVLLEDGAYSFTATSFDVAGNASAASGNFRVVIDTAAPTSPVVQLDPVFDTGAVGDLETSSPHVSLVGSTEPDSRVTLTTTGAVVRADSQGSFRFEGVPLTLGSNTLNFDATDLAGNSSTGQLSIVRVPQVNQTPLVAARLLNDTGVSDRDDLTNDPTLVGNIVYPNDFVATLELEFDGPNGRSRIQGEFTDVVDTDGSFTLNQEFLNSLFVEQELPFGFYRYSIHVADASDSSNVGVHFGEMAFVPQGADSPPIGLNIGLQNDTGPIATDRLSTDPTLTGFAVGSQIQTVRFFYDSADQELSADITDRIDANGDFVLDQPFLEDLIGGPLEFKRHDYHLEVFDDQGNFAFKYGDFGYLESDDDDIVAPVLEVSLANDTGIDPNDGVTNSLVVTGIVTDESPVSVFALLFDLNTFDEYEADISSSVDAQGNFVVSMTDWENIIGGPVADGQYEISIFAQDQYSFATETILVQLDTSTVATPNIQRVVTDTGASDSDGVTNDPTFSIHGVGEPGSLVELSESGLGNLGRTDVNEDGQWRFEITGAGLVDGDYQFFATGFSLAGNPSELSNQFDVTLDTDSPLRAVFRIDESFNTGDPLDNITSIGVVDIVGTTTPGANVTLIHNRETAVADGSGNFRFQGVQLRPGDHSYEVQTSDLAGNIQSSSRRLTWDQPITLNDNTFVSEETRVFTFDDDSLGFKTVRFRVDADFGEAASSVPDSFQVYVLDSNDTSATIVDLGIPGTAAFSLSDDRAQFRAGNVRFDGTFVEIDLSILEAIDVQFRFQLIDNDGTRETQIEVQEIGVYDAQTATGIQEQGAVEVGPAGPVDLNELTIDGSLGYEVVHPRLDSATGVYSVGLELTNSGSQDLAQSIAVVFDNLPQGVTLLNPSGFNDQGHPYVSFADGVPTYGLMAGQRSAPVSLEFSTDGSSPFANPVSFFHSGPANAPTIAEVSDILAMPGQVIEVQLSASGAQGAYFTMNNDGSLPDMVLHSDGRLTIAPKPDQIGDFTLEVFATDGIRETSTSIHLQVVADSDTTSRISGVVMDTQSNPLPGIPIELGGVTVQTQADGTFELTFPGSIPNDALKIHGDAYQGGKVYPFVAEKLPLLLGHDAFDNINNVVARPIYLPALDVANGVAIDPSVDVTVTTSNIPGASVFVAAGSLEAQDGGSFDGELSITEVPAEFTPAALPADIFPDLVVTIQPGEMVFNTPAPLSLPNLSGFPAGTEMILWSINPITGLFDNVGTGVVSADESVIETIEGGIRNSSWHMFSAVGDAQISADENPHNEEKDCDPCSQRNSPNSANQQDDVPRWNERDFRNDAASDSTASDRSSSSTNSAGQRTGRNDFGNRYRTPQNRTNSSLPFQARSGGGFGSGWGSGGDLILGSKGDFGPYGSWDFTPKPTFTFGFNHVPEPAPIEDVAARPDQETEVSLHSGALHKQHSLVAYQSLNRWRGLELHYDSERADARPIFNVSMDGIPRTGQRTLVTKVTVSRGNMQLVVPGFQGTAPGLTGGEHFFSIPDEATALEASVQADLNQLPTGIYTYETASRVARGVQFSGRSTSTSDEFIHVNSRDSEFGVGWGLSGLTQLIENPDGSVLLVDGNGGERVFLAPSVEGDPYQSPADDFSTLEKLPDGRFRRTHTDQLVEEYSFTNKLATITDRHGNQTQFLYNASDRLQSIVDPVGLTTTLRYTAGLVTEIEDPAGRITKLAYDDGNLIRIEDPDLSSRQFRYDSANRLIEETDKRGSVEQIRLGFSGRVESIIRKDGSRITYNPVQTANLVRPELTSAPGAGASVSAFRPAAISNVSDANGNLTRVVVDKAGQLLNSQDGQGLLPQVERNQNNLVQRVVDGRGNETQLEYDERGNVIRSIDEVARVPQTVVQFASSIESIVTFDLNGDNILDLVVTMPESNSLAFAFGIGDGVFEEPVEMDAGLSPNDLVAADFNNDGWVDLAVTSEANQRVGVFFNDGSGGFEPTFEAVVNSPANLVASDFDNDGLVDLGIGGFAQYAILTNQGDDSFSTKVVNLNSQTGLNRIATGDFNADGNIDLAIGAPEFVQFTNQVEVHIGSGDGVFSLLETIDVGGGTDDGSIKWELSDLLVRDIDADGIADILATTPYTNDTHMTNVTALLGVGDGTFSAPLNWTAGLSPESIAVADWNADGLLDLIVTNPLTNRVSTLRGLSGDQFESPIDFESNSQPFELAVGDFDSDGFDDFAVTNRGTNSVTIFSPSKAGKQFEYDPTFNQLQRTVDELGREVIYDIDPVNGNTLAITQVVGQRGGDDDVVTQFSYTPEGLVASITDPLGRVTENEYNPRGLLVKTTYAVGTTEEAFVTYEYDNSGNRTVFVNELGHRTEYVFDAMNRVIEIIEADPDESGPLESPRTNNQYDHQGNLIRTTDAEGKSTQFRFDFQNRLVETIDANQNSILHQYDATGNLSATIDRLGRRTEFVYDQRNRLVQVINAEGGQRFYSYDEDNNRTAMIDEAGVRTEYAYDARNRMTSQINALGGVRTYEYDPVNNLVAVTDELGRRSEMEYDELNRLVLERGPDPDGNGFDQAPVNRLVYDLASNLISTTDALGNVTNREYDQRNRLIRIVEPDPDGAGPLDSPVTEYDYDDANRLIEQVDPLGRETQLVYDNLSRLIREIHPDPDNAGPQASPVVHYTYDSVDNLESSTDALGNTTVFAYDNLHRQVSITGADPDGTGPGVAPVVITGYDAEGQVVQKTDPLGRTTRYRYDLLGHVVETKLPDPDGVGPLEAPVMTYQYDLVGNETLMVDALGNRTVRSYDDLYRLVKITEEDPDGESGPAVSPTTRFRYDAAHQLVAETDALNRTTRYEYDELGRLTKEIYPDPDGNGGDSSPSTTHIYDLIGNQIATVDPLGNRTDFIFDQLYRLISTIEADPDGSGPHQNPVTLRSYDAASQLVSQTDPLGRTSTFVYDQLGRMIQQRLPDPDGAGPTSEPIYEFSYDLVGNPVSVVDALGNETITVYDDLHRVVQVIEADPDGEGPDDQPITTYSYDAASQLVAMTDALGRATTMVYDNLGRQIQLTRPDPDGPGSQSAPQRQFFYDSMDNLIASSDAEGNTTTYIYDRLYRNIETVSPDPDDAGPQSSPVTRIEFDLEDQMVATTDPLGRRTEFIYDDLGRIIQRILPDPDGGGVQTAPVYTFTYDLLGNQLSSTDAVGNVTQFEYDSLYRRTRIIRHDPDGAGPLTNPVKEFQFDNVDQLLAETDEVGRTTTYVYDQLGRLIQKNQPDPDGAGSLASPQFFYSYDLMNNKLRSIDPLGFEMIYEYDNLYRVVREIGEDLDGDGPLGRPVTSFSYDLVDNQTSLTDSSGNRTEFSYDGLDRVFEESIELGSGNVVKRFFDYDLEDHLIRKTDRNGRVTEFHLDRLYRLVEEAWLDENGTVINSLDYQFDEANQLLRSNDTINAANNVYTYDGLSRVVSETVDTGGEDVVFHSRFDAQSRRIQYSARLGTSNDFLNRYQYDGLNRVASITQTEDGGTSVAPKHVEFGFNGSDQLVLVDRFAAVNNDVGSRVFTTEYQYDGIGRFSSIEHENDTEVFSRFDYQFDANSRIAELNHSVDGRSQFTYDREDQIVESTHASQPNEAYQHDQDGNRLGVGYETGFYNRLQADEGSDYSYDNEGNLVKQVNRDTGEVREFAWDHRNRLVAVSDRASDGGPVVQVVSHRYDAMDRWIAKSVDQDGAGPGPSVHTQYYYDGRQIVLSVTDGSVSNRYLWAPGRDSLVVDESAAGQSRWVAVDHQNSIRDIVDASGSVVNHIQYDSFGNISSQSNSGIASLFGYTGKPFEATTQLQNNWHRWYSSKLGRWLSEDPVGFNAGDVNLYRYVGNSSTNSIDPDGLDIIQSTGMPEADPAAEYRDSSFGKDLTWSELATRTIRNTNSTTRVSGLKKVVGAGKALVNRAIRPLQKLKSNSVYFNQAAEIEQYERDYGINALRQRMVHALELTRLTDDSYEQRYGVFVEGTNYKSLMKFEVKDVSFFAKLYQNQKTCKYVLVFRGTHDHGRDWFDNFGQGLGMVSPKYEYATFLARKVAEKFGAENVQFAGHSLGGGMATAAAVATNRPGFVVSPSGLHRYTARNEGGTLDDANRLVTGVRLWGEILTTIENFPPEFLAPDAKGDIITIPTDQAFTGMPFGYPDRKSIYTGMVDNHSPRLTAKYIEMIINRIDERNAQATQDY